MAPMRKPVCACRFGNNAGHIGVYGGGYWFDNKDTYQAVTGFKARAELALNDVVGPGSSLTARYEYSDDKARGVRQVFGVGLRIPFGGSSARPARATGAQDWRMTDPLERDTDIVIGQSNKEQVADGYTGVTFDRVAYANDGTTLANGISQGANTLIILDGAKNPVSGGETLGSQQTLLGGGGTLKVTGVNTGAIGYVTAPGSRPTISNTSGSGYALTLAGYNTVNGVDVTSSLMTGAGINGVALGGIDGSGESHLAIVDTNVNVSMSGFDRYLNGITEINNSTLTGINLANADHVWLNNTTVTATMTGTGGDGSFPSGDAGAGINSSTLTAINLSGAGNVWLTDTTVTATMTGTGGWGGNGRDGSIGGAGGNGITDGTVTGIDLANADHVWLNNTTATATMTGTGGNGGDGGLLYGSNGGAGGNGGNGIDGATLTGINLSGAGNVWLTNTTVTAMMTGRGGDGGKGGIAYSDGTHGGNGGDGGDGITGSSTLMGIDLSGVSDVWLANTSVTASMSGTGGHGGAVGYGGGGTVGANGTGITAGITPHGLYPDTMPIPGVIFSGSTTSA